MKIIQEIALACYFILDMSLQQVYMSDNYYLPGVTLK